MVLPAGSDYQLSDASGKTWTLDEKGEVTSVGEKADTKLAQNQGKNNLPKGQPKPENFEIQWDFSQSEFAFDASGEIPHKALVKGKNDVFQVVIKQKDALRYSFHFQTDKGLKIDSKKEKDGVFEISRKGLFDFADEELWVVAKNTNTEKEEVIGKYILAHLSEKEVNVTLIPTAENLPIDTEKIKAIYAKVGIKLTISTDKVFPVKKKIDTENAFGDLSTYSPEQQAIIAWYKSEREVKPDTYYVFVGKQESSQAGYMRLGGQFGFVMDANERTIAHELGHGIFKLEHPFKKDETKKGTFRTLMDYAQETTFAYSDWKQINDPKLRIGFFEEQSDGEYIIKKLEYVVCIPRVLIDKNRVYEDLDGRKILFKNGAYPFAFVAQDPKEHSGQVAGVFYKGEMYLPYYYTQDEKHAESYRLYKGGLKQDSLPKEAYEIITEDVKPLKIGVDNKEYITFNGISQNIKGKLCSGIPTISNVLAIGEVTSDEISLYNSQIAKSKEKIGVNTFVLMTKDGKKQNVVEKFLSSPEDDEVFIWANYEGGQWVVKRISFAGCVNTHPNLAIVCSMKAALSKAGFTSKMMLADILDALSEMVGYLEIPEHYYNPELPNYNPTLYYISHIDVNAIALKIADFAPNKNIPETYFAIKCGIWNGLVGQVKDLPDFMSDLLTGETSFTMIMEGLKKMDFFCTESKGDNVCLWSMIKEAHQGNQYQIAHQVGKDISEVLTIALSFAKVGKLAKIAKVADVLDPIHHLAKYAGKGVTVVFDKSTKAVRFVFDNLKFIEKYELKIRFGTNKLYAGLPLPDINLKKKLDELSQKDLENLISDQNGIKIIEVDGNLIPVGNEENINKIIVATDNFLNSIDKKTLEKLKNVPGFDKVITDMAQHWKKFKGGKFQLEYATKLLEEGASIRFEVSNLSDDIKRIYDIEIKKRVNGRTEITNLELKNWSNFYPETIKNQFVKDLQKMGELGNIQWIFNKTNNISDISVLKTNVIKALKKADGTPIEEISKLFKNDGFKDKVILWMNTNEVSSNSFLDWLDKPENFNKFFEIVE
ncbi:hypothetical protein [Capnocytophaga felis]|uniref:Uncharacterized protein n=1 Tax=Capnocytophaga felis TaxID=2267611 RepID=A0A5M4B999_9FLAO|nr:hypothetical protein [Capnocytophaga felis]GET46193.1 hypothetical protein RCZ01_14950 [Capnocytophaga felis]GET48984.1 hypothetical protein RCZ02_18150 [Capnocytophaga felis]